MFRHVHVRFRSARLGFWPRTALVLLVAMLTLLAPALSGLLPSAAAATGDDGTRTLGAHVGTPEGFGANVTGGAGGSTYWVTSLADSGPGTLRTGLSQPGATWIRFRVSGTITLRSQLVLPSNTTIDGRDQKVTIAVDRDINGMHIGKVSNIIIHNLVFVGGIATRNTPAEPRSSGIDILGGDRIWIDHNTMTGWGDKLIDMSTVGSATVSYNAFHDASPGHAILIGTKSTAHQQGRTRVSVHHNTFLRIPDRSPRIGDGGHAHVYNNYVQDWSYYGMKAVRGAHMLAENNVFGSGATHKAISSTEGGAAPGNVRADGNLLLDSGLKIQETNRGTVFTPNYNYNLQPASTKLRDRLLTTAGWSGNNEAGTDGRTTGGSTTTGGGSTGAGTSPAFVDVPRGHVFYNDVTKLAQSGITKGCAADRFCPDDVVTRGQAAAFLDRALGLPDGRTRFTDARGHLFESSIGALARSGITKGCSTTRFCPDEPMTRGQFAAFIDRALGLPDGRTRFTDARGHMFEAPISAINRAGITRGCSNTRFCPDAPVTRGQVAAFLVRASLAE